MRSKKRIIRKAVILLVVLVVLYWAGGSALTALGRFLVRIDPIERSDAVVVLSTGVEYYARLSEAARLYAGGLAARVVVNGNRKSDVLRELERRGLEHCCPWYEENLRILEVLGVPRRDVLAVSAEDVYDTITEARAVGDELIEAGVSSIIIATSKSHTRRASFIWEQVFPGRFTIRAAPAVDDPYSPEGWWKDGRQIRWVLAEYGAWLYYAWDKLRGADNVKK